MANAVHVDSTKHFNSYLQNTEYVVVDFTASWCGPCRTIAPIYEKLAKEHTQPGKIAFLKVDVDEQQEVAQYYNITAMPTFLVIKNLNVLQMVRGANPPALTAAIQSIAKAAASEPAKPAEEKQEPKAANDESVGGAYGITKGSGWKMSLN